MRVFYHDKCFDGASSAALFSRFYKERIRSDVDFVYSGLLHRAGALFDEKQFDGNENAIVDFKYSSSPKITWWFDHHESAFLSPDDAAHFEQDQGNRKFYDPDFKSCTSFIAMIAEKDFGFDPRPVAELVHWTDIVDAAQYEDAKSAVEMQAPAMKLTMAIEASTDRDFVKTMIPLLATYHGQHLENPALPYCRFCSTATAVPWIFCGSAKRKTARSSSTSPIWTWKATTSSSRTICTPTRFIASA